MNASTFRHAMNLWPPFLFNSIRVQSISPDYSEARVVLRLRPWNRNYVRSQFGGSVFAMTDPFWMLLVMHQLGNDYFVWDKAGAIDAYRTVLAIKPGFYPAAINLGTARRASGFHESNQPKVSSSMGNA